MTRSLLLYLLICTTPLFAAETVDPIDTAMEAEMEQNGSTGGMVEAISKAHAKWEEKMNRSYKSLKASMASDEFTELQQAQRAWITYRDKQVAAYGNSYGKMDGTMWVPAHASAVMSLTRQRAKELESLQALVSERYPSEESPTQETSNADFSNASDFEAFVRAFLNSDYTSNSAVAKAYLSPEFAALCIKACNPPPGETIYWGADPIMETQDMNPKLLSLGPASASNGNVLVPVIFTHDGLQPFTKTFVFSKSGSTWRISDILTIGLRDGLESEFKNLKANL